MSGGLIVFLEIIAPLVVLIVYGRIKIVRARRKAEAEDASAAKLPFEPRPEPPSGLLLRSFTTPQRAYLRQQIALAKGCFYIVGWVSLVLFTAGLLPQYVNEYGLEQPLAQRVWYSYLNHVTVSQIWFAFAAFAGAFIAISALASDGPVVIFNRTRPLPRSFLFWAPVLSAIATVLAATAMGAIVSFALLLLFYGPVWLHLVDGFRGRDGYLVINALTRLQKLHFAEMLLTSVPRIFLSIATTAILVFSVVSAMIAQPFSILRKSGGKAPALFFAPIGAVAGIVAVHIIHGVNISRSSRALFVYASLGPPPPWIDVLVPLTASALLLLLARFWVARKDL